MTNEGHLLEATRYIALNPVRAGLCRRAEDWEWSSYGATINCRTPDGFVDYEGLLRCFGSRPASAIRALRAFVDEA